MEDLIRAIQDLGQYSHWDYILFGADVISVIISAIAVFAAISIPKKIAKSQNDIALFEKRYQLYKILRSLVNFGKQLSEIKEENLINTSTKTRARHYLMGYIISKGRDFDEVIDIGLNFKFVYDDDHNFLGYEVFGQCKEDMQSYKLRLRQHIDTYGSTVELTSFLFSKDNEELLQKLATTYFAFMNLVCNYAELDNNNITKIYIDEEVKKLDYQTCQMEISKKEFLNAIKEISDKSILEEVKGYLRIKE